MRIVRLAAATAMVAPLALSGPASAKAGDAVQVSDDLAIDPIIDLRLRYEGVDQPTARADALTLRMRAGAEFRMKRLGILVEGEGTLGIVNAYNAFPFAIGDRQRRPGHATVADPMNVEINRIQLQYKGKAATVTLGRQRINLDDQRWVGAAAWRQNEQTFDAVRGEAQFGPISLDGAYAIGQRTIYGIDAGSRQSLDGTFIFAGAGVKAGPVTAKGFAYVLDYDESIVFSNSSVTYGGRIVAALPLVPRTALTVTGSYARQSDYGKNPVRYAADYLSLEAVLAARGLSLTAGFEALGSDADAAGGAGRAVQTPLATLHKFNGWADMFLTTPNKGLHDAYLGAAYKFDGVKALPGLNAAITWHRFGSDTGDIHYGNEWDGSLGFRLGRYTFLGKYANYDAKSLGVDTEKVWLQVEMGY